MRAKEPLVRKKGNQALIIDCRPRPLNNGDPCGPVEAKYSQDDTHCVDLGSLRLQYRPSDGAIMRFFY